MKKIRVKVKGKVVNRTDKSYEITGKGNETRCATATDIAREDGE